MSDGWSSLGFDICGRGYGKLFSLMSLFGFSVLLCNILQDKGSNEIVFKAMGRAINKTVTIVELIKVILVTST